MVMEDIPCIHKSTPCAMTADPGLFLCHDPRQALSNMQCLEETAVGADEQHTARNVKQAPVRCVMHPRNSGAPGHGVWLMTVVIHPQASTATDLIFGHVMVVLAGM